MRGPLLVAAALLGAPAAAAPVRHGAPVHRAAAPAVHDWSHVVVATPQGGFRIGNPAARVKLIEYGSLSCPHCAHFEATGAGPLVDRYVKTGRVSWEFRTYLLFPTDPAVSLLLHCRGAPAFFPLASRIYASQPQWTGRVSALPQQEMARLQAMPPRQRATALAAATGLDTFFIRHGMTAAQVNDCLANPAGLSRLLAITERGNKAGVEGTPTFFINGAKADTGDWDSLEPLIRKAGG
jgi:protein-disulfide isomerase